jgi:hypothetical protein
MKSIPLALGLLLAGSATAADQVAQYGLLPVAHDQIDLFMVRGTPENNTPEALQGLWWMNGNPLPDEIVSFAGVEWQEIVENGAVVGYRGALPVYDEGVWSWHKSAFGRGLYNFVLSSRLVYVAEFNKDFSAGIVTPTFEPFGSGKDFEIPASNFVTFAMNKVDDNEYARDSIVLGGETTYRFRRVVDANGVRLPAWQDYLSKVETKNAWLPVCLTDSPFAPLAADLRNGQQKLEASLADTLVVKDGIVSARLDDAKAVQNLARVSQARSPFTACAAD